VTLSPGRIWWSLLQAACNGHLLQSVLETPHMGGHCGQALSFDRTSQHNHTMELATWDAFSDTEAIPASTEAVLHNLCTGKNFNNSKQIFV